MNQDETRRYLQPAHSWKAAMGVVGFALAVAASVWASTEWLHSRADEGEVKEMRKDSFQTRLDMETMKGDMKAINIRIDESFKQVNGKLDELGKKRR